MTNGEADIVTSQQPPKRVARPPHATSAAVEGVASDTALPRVLPFALFIAFVIAADVMLRLGAAASTVRWLYPVKVALVAALLLMWRNHYHELRSPLALRQAVLAVGAGVAVFLLWISLDAGWMQLGTPRGFDPADDAGRIDWPLVAFRIAGAALLVPVMEELFWRSFLLRWLQQRNFLALRPSLVRGRPVVISVFLFGFEHHLWLAGIVAGVAYTLLFMRSESLWTPILGHAVTNGLLGAWVMATGSWTYW